MAERLLMTDLSGGKFSSVVLGSIVFSEGFDCSSHPVPMTNLVGSWAASSALWERTVR